MREPPENLLPQLSSITHSVGGSASSAAAPEDYATSGAEFLMSEEVALWLRVSQATLCRWRQSGCGPRVTWMSRTCPRYRRSDVESWLKKVSA